MEFKIKLKIKDVEIDSLNLEELKELKEMLDSILNVKKEVVKEKEYIPYPIYIEKRYRYWDYYPQKPYYYSTTSSNGSILCSGGNSGTISYKSAS